MSLASDPLIGLNITGSYVIRHKLAEGGMGAVYIAINDLGNKKVVKVLLPVASQHPQIRERFDREARAAARLKGQPHIVEVDDVGHLPNGQQFLTMEFLHGRPLDEHIGRTGRLSPHHAFKLITQIGRGLHELHTAGIVHRDLKPGNVFLTNRDDKLYVKLIDLGIAHDATFIDSSGVRTMTGMAMGTPGYMAPEQYTDAGSVSPTADIYALAVILCELLTGARPWDAPNPSMLFHLQQTQPPNIASVEMPPAWRPILVSALAVDPMVRPQSVYALLAALASELSGDERLGIESGAQMMASFARRMLEQAPPDSETVRARGQVPIMWPQLLLTASPSVQNPVRSHAAPPPKSSPLATRNERPAAANAQPISTIGGASAVLRSSDGPVRVGRVRLVVGALGVVAVAALATFGLSHVLRSESSGGAPTSQPDVNLPNSMAVDVLPMDATGATTLVIEDARSVDAAGVVPPDGTIAATAPTASDAGATSHRRSRKKADASMSRGSASTAPKDDFDPDGVEE